MNSHRPVSVPYHDKTLATAGLNSYRYQGPYGWIMIGAEDDEQALREAQRSTSAKVTADKLQMWSGSSYLPTQAPI